MEGANTATIEKEESKEEKIARLETLIEKLTLEAYSDNLTGLKNRRALEKDLKLIFHAKREGGPDRRNEEYEENICTMMIDVDYFKKINDTYGHDAGDKILVEISERLKKSMPRGKDIVARYGGEEFIAFLVEASQEDMEKKAEVIKNIIASQPFNIDTTEISMTISIGMAFGNKDSDPKLLIKQADEALYRSKNSGRNKVTVFSKNSE